MHTPAVTQTIKMPTSLRPPHTSQPYGRRMRTRADFGDPSRRVTDILLATNVAVFALDALLAGQLLLAGAKINELIVAGQIHRFLTPAFLHGDLIHLGFNSMFLHSIGPQVEQLGGHARFVAVYGVAAVTGTLASFAFSTRTSVGASGALFGLAGALWVFAERHKGLLPRMERLQQSLTQTIGFNILYGLTASRIDNWGHLGGLLGGALAAFLLGPQFRVGVAGRLVDDPPVGILKYRRAAVRADAISRPRRRATTTTTTTTRGPGALF